MSTTAARANKPMQFDHDLQSPCGDLFLYLRDIFLSFEELHEIKNPKQTSYKDGNGMAIILMRVRQDGVRLIFARGARMMKRYPFLQGEGKIVRHMIVRTQEAIDEKQLKEMIEESLVLAMEHREIREMRKSVL